MLLALGIGWGILCVLMWMGLIVTAMANPHKLRELTNTVLFIVACSVVEIIIVALYTALKIKGLLP